MSLFTSAREKRYWLLALLVAVAIFSPLAFGQPLESLFRNPIFQGLVFVFCMLLVAVSIFLHGFQNETTKTELVIWLGLTAVYIMLFLRLSLSERSHLFEYSVLAIFIHQAISERYGTGINPWKAAITAFALTCMIGALDEWLQMFIPSRIFDPLDIVFNCFAALMAIGGSMAIFWIRKKQKSSDHPLK